MRLDRPYAEEELPGDLGVGVAEGDEPEDVDLALGQASGRSVLRRSRGEPRAEGGVHVRLPGAGGVDGLHELGVRGFLEHVGGGAGL